MIAIISDTHIPARAKRIPEPFLKKIQDADTTVHAGDFETAETYKQLEEHTDNLYAVMGNCDRFQLPQSETFTKQTQEIGVYHGTGITPRGHKPTLLDIARNKLEVDILVHGHTHQQETTKEKDTILINPGSATGVGGGSSTTGNPKMSTLKVKEKVVEVKQLELIDGQIRENKETFQINH